MPSTREESDWPFANGASEVETSADPEKVIMEYQCDGCVIIDHQHRGYVRYA